MNTVTFIMQNNLHYKTNFLALLYHSKKDTGVWEEKRSLDLSSYPLSAHLGWNMERTPSGWHRHLRRLPSAPQAFTHLIQLGEKTRKKQAKSRKRRAKAEGTLGFQLPLPLYPHSLACDPVLSTSSILGKESGSWQRGQKISPWSIY